MKLTCLKFKLLIGALFLSAHINHAAVVTTLADSGPGSLREAITNAISGEVITFDGALAGGTILLTTGELLTSVDLTIDGGNQNIKIDGNGSSSVLHATDACTVQNITIQGGNNGVGGGINKDGAGALICNNVLFRNNNGWSNGGAVYTFSVATHIFRNCTFHNNTGGWGGAIYKLFGSADMENCLFAGNSAGSGGAMHLRGGNTTILGCTVAGNYGTSTGGALWLDGATVNIQNSIFWNNQVNGGTPADIESFYQVTGGAPTLNIEYSIIQGSGGSGSWNGGYGNDFGANLDVDPIFVNPQPPTSAPTTAGSYELDFGSPAQNSGNNPLSSGGFDLLGNNRIHYGTIDRGAYELCRTVSSATLTVCDFYNSPAGNTYTTSGIYLDTLTNSLGCDSVITTNLTVDLTAVVNAGLDVSVCAESPNVALSGSVTNALGSAWTSTGTGVFSDPLDPNATYIPSAGDITGGTVTLTLTSTGNGACAAVQDNMVITINPTPTVNAGADQTVCDGTSVTLSGTGSAIAYTWDNGVTDGTPFTPSVGSVLYTVTGTDANGCVNTDQVTVTVNPLPVVSFGAIPPICENGTSYTLVEGTPAGGTYSGTGVVGGTTFDPTIPGAGTYVLTYTYTDGNGCVNSATSNMLVNPAPAVSFNPIPDICENALPYTLTQGTPPGGTYTGTGIAGSNFNPVAAGTGSHTLTYTYTDGNGCTNNATQNINVLGAPIVTAGGNVAICDGDNTTISASGANTYVWDNALGAGATHVVSPTITTNYAVTGTAANGCSNSDTVMVTVNPLPAVTFGALPDQCINGTPYTLIEGTPAGGVYSGTGVTGATFDPVMAGTGTHTLTYTYTDGNGCSDFATSNILVYNNPTVSANATSTSICDGDAVTLTGGGALSYTWDNGVTDGVSFIPAIGTVTYTVTGSDANGCTNTDQVDVTVNPLPNVNAGPDQTICDGTAVTLNGAGAVTYTWDNGVTDGVSFNPTVTQNYVVTGVDANSCSNTDTTSVTVNPNPVLTVSPDQIFCLGDSITLSASGGDSYNWDSGAGNLADYQVSPTVTTTYSVDGVSSLGCTSTANVTLTLDDPANVDAGVDQTICAGFTVYLSATGGISYEWNGPGFVSDPNQDINFTVDTTAYYYATITTSNGCVYTDSLLVTASNDPSCTIEPVSSITPNNDGVNDVWQIPGIEGFPDNRVVIYNRWGDIVFDQMGYDNDLIKWDGMYKGQVLGAGTYFYTIEITNGPTESGWIQLMK